MKIDKINEANPLSWIKNAFSKDDKYDPTNIGSYFYPMGGSEFQEILSRIKEWALRKRIEIDVDKIAQAYDEFIRDIQDAPPSTPPEEPSYIEGGEESGSGHTAPDTDTAPETKFNINHIDSYDKETATYWYTVVKKFLDKHDNGEHVLDDKMHHDYIKIENLLVKRINELNGIAPVAENKFVKIRQPKKIIRHPSLLNYR